MIKSWRSSRAREIESLEALAVACMTPRSRGTIRLRGTDPFMTPIIDHRYISDAEGEDLRVLADGLKVARAIAARHPLADLMGEERVPGPAIRAHYELENFIGAHVAHYCHPVGTCRMGPEKDSESVVDARDRVHGLDNVYVADASILPTIPRANTNLPALVVGERIARWLTPRAPALLQAATPIHLAHLFEIGIRLADGLA